MISKREFLQATAAASALTVGGGLGRLGRVAAQQRLTQADIMRFDPLGTVTILHVTDIHAQLIPLHFREPSINLGAGEAKGLPPHISDAEFRKYFNIATGSADAFALTSDDFVSLARNYGRMGGMDRIAALVGAVRAERGDDKVLLLDGGDTWQGSWTSLQTKAQDMVDIMSALKVDAMVGHWEFTCGAERVKEIADKAPFAFLAQNVRDNEWQEPVFEPRKTFERGGVKIAVIGQALPRTAVANPRWMFPKWEFGIREEDIQKQVDESRADGASIVVLLSHNGFDVDRKLAGRVKGIDVILTAHTHDAMPGLIRVGDTVLVASGSHGKFVSRLDIEVKDKKVAGVRFKLMPVFADAIKPDPAMTALVEKVRAPFAKDLARTLGKTDSLLYRRGNFNGTFDDLICNAMLSERDAEIALSPGFRWGGTLIPGDAITWEDVTNATAITYPNCYRNQMTGSQLKEVIEDIADNIFHPDPYFQGGGDMVRIGGMGYEIDISKPMGSRISKLTHLNSGKPIDAAKTYTVSGWASINENTQGPPIWDVVAAHVSKRGVVTVAPNTAVKVTGA
ncbi:thiosulfohydrolase SoxB [Bradyrhizobium elkanii]|uniref:thiosulfohydrolase SoxB n=1 Tax=Bradyrhizobium elkanii TaxID=29448 RepID=UPI0021689DB8|nr:thiosulfohydrolase SoxB [Bradyrhizobium elkanii]MCS3523824.1 sulfur-oxidizing protein SoxB [Bradyrhizobium elkanii]MCS4071479.1 sulfur-oxidizing protein SoxB [Bradyrhizobium elkanii]MCS4078111.1 sulfur-oxidizing protein SoxB [Bradyrhizobium elkanii]MCW2123303.1 sulfur-oxidizing protein SoxB [Bradyrhizobium elkanii]MCW2170050.1 sulfur-oxidizing protein SoxB [Bradyrhizobium elkanii]